MRVVERMSEVAREWGRERGGGRVSEGQIERSWRNRVSEVRESERVSLRM